MLGWAGGLALAGIAGGALMVALALSVAYRNLPEVGNLADYRPKLPLRVLSSDGVLLGEFGEERRTFTPIDQIPAVMKQAVLAAEDARFYDHDGVDYKGMVRAALENLRDARSQGASTITMQVARNFYLSTEKTFTRKLYEVLLTWKIERLLSKDRILELYLNQIFLGHRAHGFAAAAETYYGKTLSQLTVAEAAMLAGIPKAPSAFNPISNPKRAQVRQHYVLARMLDNGFITQAQHDAAREQALRLRPPRQSVVHAEYVAETVRQLVFAQYGDETYTRGLNVTVSIDAKLQEAAYRALRAGLLNFEQRQFYRGPEAFVDLPADPAALDARIAEALAEHPDRDELRAAVVTEVTRDKLIAVLQSGESITVTGAGLRPVASGLRDNAPPNLRIRRGAVVRLLQEDKGAWRVTQEPEVEGAVVALDPKTGAIRALVGGFDYGKNKFNHVTQAQRQPGSSFKPFVYSAALEKGFTPATVINDAPLFFDATETGSQPWEPKNYDGEFSGPMPLHQALARSKNMVSIRVLQSIGPAYAQEWATRFGFPREKHPAYLTMALGAGTVTPLELATGYGVFATGGYRMPPSLILQVSDADGDVLREAPQVPLDDSRRVLEARNAFVMGSLLQEITRSGTAANAQRQLKRPDLYGKTGTTNDSMDAWFAGYHPSLVAVVWIGYDTPKKLGSRETGGGLALPVWIDLMRVALKDQPVETPTPPPGVVQQDDGLWVYEEFADGGGVRSVGLDQVPEASSPEERSSILDLFRR
ncbi:MAG: penicillin-binding protein 1A [Burkholderiaceae bacterium]|nr:penicillin-binding protein 1A [Burkholderiaceae bacterium]